MRAARAGFKGLVRLTLVTGVGFGLWTALHLARRRPLPPARYTAASLQAAPLAEQNGWRDLQRGLVPPAGSAGLRAPELPRALDDMVSSKVPPRPEALQEKMPAARVALADPKTQQVLGVYRAAIGRPRFADDCAAGLVQGCQLLPLVRLHRLEELAILGAWGEGDWAGAARSVTAQLRADVDAATSSLQKSLALADTLAGHPPAAGLGEANSPTAEAADGLLRALGLLDPGRLGLDQALVVEYLLGREAIESLEASAEAPLSVLPGRGLLFYDAGRTSEEFDRSFAAWAAFVADPSRPPPVIVSHRSEAFWWAYNPVGKSVLDGLAVEWGAPVRQYTEGRAEAVVTRDRAVGKLQKLLTR
jgi:hypothetical protein